MQMGQNAYETNFNYTKMQMRHNVIITKYKRDNVIEVMSKQLEKENDETEKESKETDVHEGFWEEHILLGSDVKTLFPSLSAAETEKAVRKRFGKSLSSETMYIGGS